MENYLFGAIAGEAESITYAYEKMDEALEEALNLCRKFDRIVNKK